MINFTRLLISILTVALLFSCSSNEQQSSDTSNRFKTLDTIVPFTGFWLSEKYINTVIKTKSPLHSQDENANSITIPSKTLEVTRMVGGLHEGAADMVLVKKSDKFQFYYKYDDTIRDLAYDIELISKTKIKIGNEFFLRVNENFLEEILFKGEYIDNKGSLVEFNINGQVKGLDNYKVYSPVYDYNDAAKDVDQVVIGQTDTEGKRYGFKFLGDSLFIYELVCLEFDSLNNLCSKVDYGQLTYKLYRKE